MWGMTLAACGLVPTWFDYYFQTKVGLRTDHCCWACLHKLVPAVGVWCSISIAGVALNPWDERLDVHIFFANGIFMGGITFVLIASILGYARGLSFKRVLFVGIFAFSSLVLMSVFVGKGFEDLKEAGTAAENFRMLGTDFKGYCTGKPGSLHAEDNVNVGAMFEWFLLASVTLTCFVKLYNELGNASGQQLQARDSESSVKNTPNAGGIAV